MDEYTGERYHSAVKAKYDISKSVIDDTVCAISFAGSSNRFLTHHAVMGFWQKQHIDTIGKLCLRMSIQRVFIIF